MSGYEELIEQVSALIRSESVESAAVKIVDLFTDSDIECRTGLYYHWGHDAGQHWMLWKLSKLLESQITINANDIEDFTHSQAVYLSNRIDEWSAMARASL